MNKQKAYKRMLRIGGYSFWAWIGYFTFFTFKIFPIPVWNLDYTSRSIWWVSSRMFLGIWEPFILISLFGMALGIFFYYLLDKKFMKKEWDTLKEN